MNTEGNTNKDSDQPRHQSAAAFKAVMLKSSTKSKINLYDHLTRVLMRVMDEHPENVVDVFEDISLNVKQSLFQDKQSTLRDVPDTAAAELAERQRLLFVRPGAAEKEDEKVEIPHPNVNEIGFYLEQAGVGLGRDEMQRVFLALKQLIESNTLLHCRLWGKILGIESNYIIAQADSKDEEEEEEHITEEAAKKEHQEKEEDEMGPVLHSTFKPPPVVPKESIGSGANKFVYYVCKEPGLPWVKLPAVTPAQITVARQICKFFTGRLDSPVVSYPSFPGNEANYLRAQIARISAGTLVSPQGFFRAREEEGDEEEDASSDSFEVNDEFEGIPVVEMATSLSSWVHHAQHILQQGRCTWVEMAIEPEEEFNEDGEAGEKDEEPDEPQREVGPPLLSPCSQDAEMFNTPPWSSKISSTVTFQHAVAVLRSNLWPGAYAYSCGKKFENIYIGWGLKYTGEGHSLPVPPLPQTEYPSDPQITETLDPSLEVEQMLKEALEKQEADQEEMEIADEDEEDDDV